eukprot:1133462-Pelagomonas_calceolata.AAC.3
MQQLTIILVTHTNTAAAAAAQSLSCSTQTGAIPEDLGCPAQQHRPIRTSFGKQTQSTAQQVMFGHA